MEEKKEEKKYFVVYCVGDEPVFSVTVTGADEKERMKKALAELKKGNYVRL